MRILIVDDDRAHGEALSDLLGSRGHESYHASGLAEAAWFLELFRFDLALVDHDMPDVSGVEACRSLALRAPDLPTVAMSARETHRERCSREAALLFLPKPIAIERLLALLADLESGTSLTVRLEFPVEKYARRTRS